jgi:hypothetical protein
VVTVLGKSSSRMQKSDDSETTACDRDAQTYDSLLLHVANNLLNSELILVSLVLYYRYEKLSKLRNKELRRCGGV